MAKLPTFPGHPKNATKTIPLRKPTWGTELENSDSNQIKTTWLGHACFLVEFPSRHATHTRGIRVLFDPVFSDRCSPSQWLGPKRFTRQSLMYFAKRFVYGSH